MGVNMRYKFKIGDKVKKIVKNGFNDKIYTITGRHKGYWDSINYYEINHRLYFSERYLELYVKQIKKYGICKFWDKLNKHLT